MPRCCAVVPFAALIALRSEPAPLSFVLVTVNICPAGLETMARRTRTVDAVKNANRHRQRLRAPRDSRRWERGIISTPNQPVRLWPGSAGPGLAPKRLWRNVRNSSLASDSLLSARFHKCVNVSNRPFGVRGLVTALPFDPIISPCQKAVTSPRTSKIRHGNYNLERKLQRKLKPSSGGYGIG